jgi:hypothetical protein
LLHNIYSSESIMFDDWLLPPPTYG